MRTHNAEPWGGTLLACLFILLCLDLVLCAIILITEW